VFFALKSLFSGVKSPFTFHHSLSRQLVCSDSTSQETYYFRGVPEVQEICSASSCGILVHSAAIITVKCSEKIAMEKGLNY
jgi:hypothetical protein